jgi:hypothetical protein
LFERGETRTRFVPHRSVRADRCEKMRKRPSVHALNKHERTVNPLSGALVLHGGCVEFVGRYPDCSNEWTQPIRVRAHEFAKHPIQGIPHNAEFLALTLQPQPSRSCSSEVYGSAFSVEPCHSLCGRRSGCRAPQLRVMRKVNPIKHLHERIAIVETRKPLSRCRRKSQCARAARRHLVASITHKMVTFLTRRLSAGRNQPTRSN